MLAGKFFEIVVDHTGHQTLQPRCGSALYLQYQALLKRARTDACGIEGLQKQQHVFYLLDRRVDVMIDGQLLTDGIERFPEQSVIVERADKILHDVAIPLTEVEFAHLFFQLVVERFGLSIDHLLTLITEGVAAVIHGQVLIVAPQVAEGFVER